MCSFGTNEYITRVVTEYSNMLLRLALTRLHTTADAEDAVQEVFLRLMTRAPRFRDEAHEKAWLIRTTLNYASDLCRSSTRKNLPLEDAKQAPCEEDSGILSAVQSLPDKYSAIIHLYYYEGYRIKEIAHILGLPAPTVGTRLSRGREKLKILLKEDFS